MTTWLVTRHASTIEWARRRGFIGAADKVVASLAARDVRRGDVVIGTLPVHLAAEVCANGGRYLHIAMDVPPEQYGKELSPEDMEACGADCRPFIVLGGAATAGAAVPAIAPPEPSAAAPGLHVCIVSDQVLANLLPILKRRPAVVMLVCTPLMQNQALERIASALARQGYDETRIEVSGLPETSATDFHVAREEARALRERLLVAHPDKVITLNATGGTKVLSNAFFLEFQGFEILYADTASNCIRHMQNVQVEPEPLGSLVLSIDDYLHYQGYRITDCASDDPSWVDAAHQREALTTVLMQEASGPRQGRFGDLLGQLNQGAARLEEEILRAAFPNGTHRTFTEKHRALAEHVPGRSSPGITRALGEPQWQGLSRKLIAAQVLVETDHGLAFTSVGTLNYLKGGWLEEWAWHVARACGADDCRAGLFVNADPDATDDRHDNELDLVVLYQNRLLIAECKTINWSGAAGKQDILNKLDALGNHARGLFGRSLLVSARTLDADVSRRARAYRIKVLAARDLPRLSDEILSWMGKPSPR